MMRPGKEGKYRKHFNVVHALLGVGVFVLSVFATRSGATKAENLQYFDEKPWVVAQASLLGGFGALWLLVWARAARPPLEREVAQKESDDVAKADAGEESKREAPE